MKHCTLEKIETPGLYSHFPKLSEEFRSGLFHLSYKFVSNGFTEVMVAERVFLNVGLPKA